jgi:hypothetical protein
MSVHITDTAMTSNVTEHHAVLTPDGWTVTWLPHRVLNRNEVITAMTLAEIYASNPPADSKWWRAARSFERELDLDERDRP